MESKRLSYKHTNTSTMTTSSPSNTDGAKGRNPNKHRSINLNFLTCWLYFIVNQSRSLVLRYTFFFLSVTIFALWSCNCQQASSSSFPTLPSSEWTTGGKKPGPGIAWRKQRARERENEQAKGRQRRETRRKVRRIKGPPLDPAKPIHTYTELYPTYVCMYIYVCGYIWCEHNACNESESINTTSNRPSHCLNVSESDDTSLTHPRKPLKILKFN